MARRFYVLAAILALLALAGFAMPSPLVGVFETTPLLNGVHLVAALATAVSASRGLRTMRRWGQLAGYVFAALAVAGFATDGPSVANLLPLSETNAWFHLVTALVFLYHALLAPPTI
jgi:hypothetical protein